MNYLLIKLKRDLLSNWRQFFSVFLMAFLSILLFVGLQGSWHGLEVSLNEYTEKSKLPESWVTSTGFTKKDTEAIEKIPGVKSTSEKTRVKVSVINENSSQKYLYIDSFSSKDINVPNLVSGMKITETDSNGIWLNKEYAEMNSLETGQTIRTKLNGVQTELVIKGLIQSADRIYYTGTAEFITPNYKNYGYGIVSKDVLTEKLKYQGLPNLLELENTKDDMRSEIENILGDRYVGYFDRNTLPDVSNALDRVGQIKNLSYLFSFIFILLAILAMYTSIKKLIESQLKEIAILKALGFSNISVGIHFSSFGLIVGGGGALAGAIASPLLSLFVLETQKSMFSIPSWKISYTYVSLIVIVFVTVISVMAAFFASRKAIVGLPVQYLRGNSERKVHSIFLERFNSIWKYVGFPSRWAIRDASFNKIRILMGIVGVSGGMMLLIAGLGMPDSINHLMDKAYYEDYSYDYRVTTNEYKKIKNDYKGQWLQNLNARFTPDDGNNRVLTVIGEGNHVQLKTQGFNEIESDGIYVTKDFAVRSGIRVGDKLSLSVSMDKAEYSFIVKDIVLSEINQGAYMTQNAWEKAGGKFVPTTLLLGNDNSLSQLKNDDAIESIIDIKEQKQNADEFVMNLLSIFLMIISFAVLLVVVVLYNLGSLNFVERYRDYATLSVLGFDKKELRNITMVENLGTTFIGWLIGIPAGIWFLGEYVRTFSTIQLEYTPHVTIRNLAISTVVVWGCSLSTTFLIGKRIKKIDMVEALKGVE